LPLHCWHSELPLVVGTVCVYHTGVRVDHATHVPTPPTRLPCLNYHAHYTPHAHTHRTPHHGPRAHRTRTTTPHVAGLPHAPAVTAHVLRPHAHTHRRHPLRHTGQRLPVLAGRSFAATSAPELERTCCIQLDIFLHRYGSVRGRKHLLPPAHTGSAFPVHYYTHPMHCADSFTHAHCHTHHTHLVFVWDTLVTLGRFAFVALHAPPLALPPHCLSTLSCTGWCIHHALPPLGAAGIAGLPANTPPILTWRAPAFWFGAPGVARTRCCQPGHRDVYLSITRQFMAGRGERRARACRTNCRTARFAPRWDVDCAASCRSPP